MKIIKKYEKICNECVIEFISQYYCDEEIQLQDVDWWWAGDKTGGVLCVADEFWSMNNITDALQYKPTSNQLFDWYWATVEKEIQISLKNYIKLNK